MANDPRWLIAHENGQNQQLHAEDLAIALAGSYNARSPYKSDAFISLWGLYSNKYLGSNPPRDNYGLAAGERRPCQSTTDVRHTSSCTTVLSQLGIGWTKIDLPYVH
jgi:hypothetical protein